MFASVRFAAIGDYGISDPFNNSFVGGTAALINQESDPEYAGGLVDAYNPDEDAQQDFILGLGDAKYGIPNSYAEVHGHFCNYLADVERLDFVAGSNYQPGSYQEVALTGGNGTGAIVDIRVDDNGVVSFVALVSAGTGYASADVLGVASADIGVGGFGGSGFAIEFGELRMPLTSCRSHAGFGIFEGGEIVKEFSHGKSKVNRFFPTAGNHDYDVVELDGTQNLKQYLDYFHLPGEGVASEFTHLPVDVAPGDEQFYSQSELYYDVVQGPVHVFVLDSQSMLARNVDTQVSEAEALASRMEQRGWLQNGLENSTARWQVVTMHIPPYSSSGKQKADLRFDFEEWGADLVLAGDFHNYERLEREVDLGGSTQKTTYVVSGFGARNGSGFGGNFEITEDADQDGFLDISVPLSETGQRGYVAPIFGATFFIANEQQLSGYTKTADGVLIDRFDIGGANVDVDGSLSCDLDHDSVFAQGSWAHDCDTDDLALRETQLTNVAPPTKANQIEEWVNRGSSTLNGEKDRISDVWQMNDYYSVGDLDLDGKVDSFDLGLLLNRFGTTPPSSVGWGWGDGDLDDDDGVDSTDLGFLLNNFGMVGGRIAP